MKKKLALALSLLLAILMLAACGKTDPTAVDYNGHTYDELEQELFTNASTIAALSQVLPMQGLTAEDLGKKDVREFFSSNYGITEQQMDSVAQWDTVCEQFGTCEKFEEDSFEIEKSGNTLTTNQKLIFVNADGSKRDVDFQVVYDYYSMEITGFTIEPVYSLGEKMSKAGLNTIISMSIVFSVLILISLIIYAFRIFPYLENKKKAKTEAAQPVAPANALPPSIPVDKPKEEPVSDDGELIAVIAAAIAASEGTSTSDFVVRSIKRR